MCARRGSIRRCAPPPGPLPRAPPTRVTLPPARGERERAARRDEERKELEKKVREEREAREREKKEASEREEKLKKERNALHNFTNQLVSPLKIIQAV